MNRITPLGFNFLAAEHLITDKTKCMIITKSDFCEIGIIKANKYERFYLKPKHVAHRRSVAEMEWMRGSSCHNLYNAKHYFYSHLMQIFWLWFIIYIEFKREKLSETKYVPYSETHYSMLDELQEEKTK